MRPPLSNDTEPHRTLAKMFAGDRIYNRTVSLERCAGSVMQNGSYRSSQCKNRRRADTEHTAYCAIHDPIRVKAKDDARHAKWEAEWAERDAMNDRIANLALMRERAAVVLRQIAHGHNDPRGLAAEWLVDWDKLQETPINDG